MYKIRRCVQTCGACPSQWDLWTIEDRYIYIRYRWGHFTVSFDVNGELLQEWNKPNDDWHGLMSTHEMIKLTSGILDFSETDFTKEDKT